MRKVAGQTQSQRVSSDRLAHRFLPTGDRRVVGQPRGDRRL